MIKGKQLKHFMVNPDTSLRHAITIMTDTPGTPMILVVDNDRKLLGVLVDFDLRTALLRGETLETRVSQVMNAEPFWLPTGCDRRQITVSFRQTPRRAIPILDPDKKVAGLALISEYLSSITNKPNLVVFMAGGLGTRLRPLTNDRPKPMVEVGDKPLLQINLESFINCGFSNFLISVNYHAGQIKDYFQGGDKWGVSIDYLEEDCPLGTAGALSLIENELSHPIIVMNGDLLTRTDYTSLLDFHKINQFDATMCVREHLEKVPYGVVEVDSSQLSKMVEKPVYRLLVNAGIYVLNPSVIRQITPGRRLDMTELLATINELDDYKVGCFPVSEYWLDVGRLPDYEQAQRDYICHFQSEKKAWLNS